jgi:hypothetical protein
LRLFWCRAPSLMIGWICRLQLLLASPAQSFSVPSPVGLATIFYCLRFMSLLFFKFKVTLRLTVSQSLSLGVEPHLGLMTVPSFVTFFNTSARTTQETQPLLLRRRVY